MNAALWRPALVLGLFALATTGLLAFTQDITRERIAAAEQAALLRTLDTLIPPTQHDNDLLADTLTLAPEPLLGTRAPSTAYRARFKGAARAVAFSALAPDGYNGSISLLIAVRDDGDLAGVRVIAHRETPGLGDYIEIERTPWIRGFEGKSLDAPVSARWKVKKDGGDFDQVSGATVTPRAVVKAVRKGLEFFAANRERLFAPAAPAEIKR